MGRKEREKKEQQRQYVERLLDSDLSVAEWCEQYGIARNTMYAWVTQFAETEPELFGGRENIVDRSKRRWLESTRLNIKATKQLAVCLVKSFFRKCASETFGFERVAFAL